MYYAKQNGRSCSILFDEAMQHQAQERLALEHDLHQAVELDQFVLHYQPIFSLARNCLVGVEALVRWNHPTRGLVMPLDFIPVAEETGLILPIGRIVFRKACEQSAAWRREYPTAPQLMMSINLSGRQFKDADLVSFIQKTIVNTQVDAACLKLEVTESTLMEDSDHAVALLQELRNLQIQVGLDDFGTGYSSLALLHSLPLDVLKVDRSFVSQMTVRPSHAAIVKTILALAANLKFSVIAEGIETQEQAQMLKEMDCEFAQGYFFSRPVEPIAIGHLLRALN